MIRKIFSQQSTSITGAALVLGAASFVSRVIGVVRDRLFAHQFGAGETLDMYYAAFRIPDVVYNLLIAGALTAGFIPVFMKVLVKDEKEAWRLTNNIISILFLCSLVIGALLFFLMPWLTTYIVPGFDVAATNTTVHLSRIMLLSPILLGISGVVSGVLQSKKRFFIYSLTPIFYNLGIILAAVLFVPHYGVEALAYGVVAGALLHLLVQLPTLHHLGFRYTPLLSFADRNTRAIAALMVPRTLTLAVNQLNIVVTTIIASTLAAGSITIFNFANNLQFFPVGIVGISFALAAFPSLSEASAKQQGDAFIDQFTRTVKQILFFIIPLTIIFLLLRAQIVRVVLGSGAFDWNATIHTANTLAFFSLSLPAQALIPLLVRGFYALHNSKTPLYIAFVAVLINIIASLTLKDMYGVTGLAMAFSIASYFQLVLLWIRLRQETHDLQEQAVLTQVYKMAVAALAMVLVIQLMKEPLAHMVDMNRFTGIALQGGIAGGLGLLVYGAVAYIFRIEEGMLLTNALQSRWLRLRNIEAQVGEADEI